MLEHDYARAIVALQEEGKSDAEIASGLSRILTARGHERLVPRIERALVSLEIRNKKKNTRTMRISKVEDAQTFAKDISQAMSSLRAGAEEYETVVDDRIVGGFILTNGTTMIDASYRTALVSLYRAITANR